MGETVVETYNIFLNSDDAVNNGQSYDFQFGNNIIQTRNVAQSIRLSVSNFNMVKTWVNVNPYNGGLIFKNAGGAPFAYNLANQNVADVRDLATDFGIKTAIAINFNEPGWGGVTSAVAGPVAGIGQTGTNQISVVFTTINPHGLVPADLTNGNFAIQCVIDPQNLPGWPFTIPSGNQTPTIGGDSGLLLGANRLPSTSLISSFLVLITGANTFAVIGVFPAQRFTEPNVYLRVNPTPLVLASEGFAQPLQLNQDNALNPSQMLAEIRVDTEMVQYEPPNDRQFFAIFNQPTLGHLQVNLTDSRNRPIPIFNLNQETTGNRNFTLTLRVDILQKSAYSEIKPPEIINTTPATDDNILWRHKMGQSNFGRPMGF
tara:strand:+ start:389 stop:1507 length:1119 start_codon:yes stop_codon:yes gene_type:complete